MEPRVWFGTMFSGEAEITMCQAAISGQNGLSAISHYIVQDMPEAEAHNALWTSWNSVKSDFDLFVKVDADTVISGLNTVAKVWKLFENDSRVTGAQLKLHDFFTDSPICGLNFFSPRVVFNTSPDLYCDRVDTNHEVVLKGDSVKHLDPGGNHCLFPNDAQAFHFGLHRKLKGQLDTLRLTYDAYRKYGDRARGLALFGANIAHNEPKAFVNANSYSAQPVRQWLAFIENANDAYVGTMVAVFAEKMGWV